MSEHLSITKISFKRFNLLTIATTLQQTRKKQEAQQDYQKTCVNLYRRTGSVYQPGNKVLVDVHYLSKSSAAYTAKFVPQRDGPYMVLATKDSCSYKIASTGNLFRFLGIHHTSALKPFIAGLQKVFPLQPLETPASTQKKYRTLIVCFSGF